MSAYHRRAPRALRGRADLQDPGGVGLRLLRARQGRALCPRHRGRAPARRDRRDPRGQLLRLWLAADLDRPAARGRGGRPRPGAAADARGRDPGRQAPRAPLAHDNAGPGGPAPARPGLQRDFSAAGPDRLWVGDFTYLRSWERASFFTFVIDAFSRKVVGWQLASHMRTDLVLDALRMALGQRDPGADFALVAHYRSRLPIHLRRLHPDAHRPRRPRLGRDRRRRL